MNEFEIIEHYFRPKLLDNQQKLKLGIGDDAAVIDIPQDEELVVSIDTLVEGVHFLKDTSPKDIANKSLLVNLSDIAAMGALPRWITLSLTLPSNNFDWLKEFSKQFNSLLADYSLVLIGGDLTKGPLSITIQAHGVVPKGKFLHRGGAKPGDFIYVTGELGAAAYTLRYLKGSGENPMPTKRELQRFNKPEPRVKVGLELRDIATSCIDISDGLFSDLKHILRASKVGAEVKLTHIPYSKSLKLLDKELAIELALTGGDDYELCFTAPSVISQSDLEKIITETQVSRIGKINELSSKLDLIGDDGKSYKLKSKCYKHF
ncbi:MAG: thiamine-phosphate kinase [Chloroflexi bacterium]|nr:thiamine-phosphate kinase [Chloroflexota bacterium]